MVPNRLYYLVLLSCTAGHMPGMQKQISQGLWFTLLLSLSQYRNSTVENQGLPEIISLASHKTEILPLHRAERCPWCLNDYLMALSASPVSTSVPSLFQETHTNLSIVTGLQRSRFICRYKLCVALFKLIILVPSSFAWCLINCSIVKEGRISYQVCSLYQTIRSLLCLLWEARNKPSVPSELHIWIMQLLCELSRLWARELWDNSPVVATDKWGKEDLCVYTAK